MVANMFFFPDFQMTMAENLSISSIQNVLFFNACILPPSKHEYLLSLDDMLSLFVTLAVIKAINATVCTCVNHVCVCVCVCMCVCACDLGALTLSDIEHVILKKACHLS